METEQSTVLVLFKKAQ